MTHTHYDNLKVARNAPPEVIRAAYKALAQKYHPDRNQNLVEAERITKIINASYEVLSDPCQRERYDTELQKQESDREFSKNDSNQASEIETKNTLAYKLVLNRFKQGVKNVLIGDVVSAIMVIWILIYALFFQET